MPRLIVSVPKMKQKTKDQTVYVLVINNVDGLQSSVHATRVGADLALLDYISESSMYFPDTDDRAEIIKCEIED